jgi:hypothetical protein
MAKKQKSAKRTSNKRSSPKRAPARRASAKAAGALGGFDNFNFNPGGWVTSLLGSQTGRTIMAEALVAAAAAAAGVLVASRTETGKKAGRAIADVSRRGGTIAKEAAMSAAAAAADVITETATAAIHTASKSLLTGGLHEQDDMAETARRNRERSAH